LGTQRIVTFKTGQTFLDGTRPRSPGAHPLADNLYKALAKPMEFVILGGRAATGGDELDVVDPFDPNTYPQTSRDTRLWKAASGRADFRGNVKKAVRFRGDADVRDEVLVLNHIYGQATL